MKILKYFFEIKKNCGYFLWNELNEWIENTIYTLFWIPIISHVKNLFFWCLHFILRKILGIRFYFISPQKIKFTITNLYCSNKNNEKYKFKYVFLKFNKNFTNIFYEMNFKIMYVGNWKYNIYIKFWIPTTSYAKHFSIFCFYIYIPQKILGIQ